MSGKEDIYPCIPSPATKQQFKTKLSSAAKGHSILKKKTDALRMAVKRTADDCLDKEKEIQILYKQAVFLKAASEVTTSGLLKKRETKTSLSVERKYTTLLGVSVPALNLVNQRALTKKEVFEEGKTKRTKAVNGLRAFLAATTQLVGLKLALEALQEAFAAANRKVNALEFVVIPKLEKTLLYIEDELEEKEREEIYRMKRVVTKKLSM